jgi:WD40 repeat protein
LYQFSHARLQETLANTNRQGETTHVQVGIRQRRLGRAAVATAVAIAACFPLAVLPDNTARITLPGSEMAFYLRDITISPDGRHLAALTDDHTAMVWALPTGQRVAALDAHFNTPHTIEFSPDGRLIAVSSRSGGGTEGTGLPPSTTTVWNVTNWQELVNGASEIRFLAEGRAMIVARQRPELDRQDLELWDTSTGILRKKLSAAQNLKQLKMIEAPSADRFLVPSPTGAPTLVKASTGDEMQLLPTVDLTATTFSDDGTMILASTPSGLMTWNAEDGHFIGTIAAESSSHVTVASLSSARMAIVYGRTQESDADDDAAGIWNTETGSLIRSYQEPTGFGMPAISSDGQVAAFSMPGRDATLLVSLMDGKEIGTIPGETTFVGDEYGLDETGDAVTLLLERLRQPASSVNSAPSQYRLWDGNGKQVASLHATNSTKHEALGADLLESDFGHPHEYDDTANDERINVLFASDGATVAAFGSRDGSNFPSILTLYKTQSGNTILTAPTEDYESLEASASGFSSDSKIFAATYRTHVVLWDVRTGQKVADVGLGRNPNALPRLAFDPQNGTMTTTISDSEAAQVWDLRDGNPRGELTGHSGAVEGILYSNDGRTIYTYGSDETVRIWSLPS